MLQQTIQNTVSQIGIGTLTHKVIFYILWMLLMKTQDCGLWILVCLITWLGKLLCSLNIAPCTTNLTIRIADRSLSKMASIIIVRISKDIHLDPVLFVPNLDCNLLSISKLTRDLKNDTKFFSLSCEFQNLDLKRMIGNTKMCARPYSFRANDLVKQS